jgi:NAD(P)H-hydrate epimerase
VSLATRGAHVAATLAARPEIMVHGADDLAIDALVARADVVAIGPGLGQGEWGRRAWSRALGAGKPLVVDADALNLLAQAPERLPRDSVITPHPGEAARLLAASTARVQDDRYAAVLELARRYRCVALLKGAGTLVADPDGRVGACPIAEPALASGGTGDVLTGVVAGLRAQGLGPFDAAAVGALVHARAAQRAAVDGARGTLAGDLFAGLRALVNP